MFASKIFFRGLCWAIGWGVIGGANIGAQTPIPILSVVEIEYDFYAGHRFEGKLERPEAVWGYEPGESDADDGEFWAS
jgi:hypothetical protein